MCFAQSVKPLRNDDIGKMVAAGLSDDTIAMAIHSRTCEFDTSVSALIDLKKAGVSQRIMQLMVATLTAPPKLTAVPANTPALARTELPATDSSQPQPSFIEANGWAHRDAVSSLAVTPDGRFVVSGSRDKTIKVWSWPEGRLVKTLEGHSGHVTGLAISQDGAFLYSSSMDKTVRVWSLPDGAPQKTIGPLPAVIFSLSISPDGKMLAGGAKDGHVTIWALPDGAISKTIETHGEVANVSFSPDGNLLAYNILRSLGRQIRGRNQIKVVDTKTWAEKQTLEHTGSAWLKGNENVFAMKFVSPSTLVAGEATGATFVWSVETGGVVGGWKPDFTTRRLSETTGDAPVWSVAVSPGWGRLAACSDYGVNVLDGSGRSEALIPQANCSSLALPNGETLLIGDFFGHIQVWSGGSKGFLVDRELKKNK